LGSHLEHGLLPEFEVTIEVSTWVKIEPTTDRFQW
jgi:hypothetical protein